MDTQVMWWLLIGLASGLVLALVIVIQLYGLLQRERFARRSQSSRYGKLTEQFLPLVEAFPWDPSKFRFLGTPIDGVQFEENAVIFVEFKAANSQLSPLQRRVRDLVEDGKVKFAVVRVG